MLGLFSARTTTDTLRDALPIPDGVTFRAWRGPQDFAAMAAVVEGCREADRIDPRSEAEHVPAADDLARTFAPEFGHDPSSAILIVEAGGQVIGYNVISWWVEDDGTRVYHHRGYLLPEWRGQRIGGAMLRWAEARIADLAAGHPREDRAAISANATSTEQGTARLLLREGYEPHQSFDELALDLNLHLADAYLPMGFELRPVRPEHLPGLLPGQSADADSLPYHIGLWRAAWADGKLAGVVRCEPSSRPAAGDIGLVTGVEVRSGYRNSGVARGLLLHALHGLKRRGFAGARLFAPGDAPLDDHSLYASVGFKTLKQYTRFRKALAV